MVKEKDKEIYWQKIALYKSENEHTKNQQEVAPLLQQISDLTQQNEQLMHSLLKKNSDIIEEIKVDVESQSSDQIVKNAK